MDENNFATKEDFWRLQSAVNDLTTSQAQHSDRIMRLEKRADDSGKSKGLWGASSPFPASLHSDSTLNPAAEAFRNFDNDPPTNMISSLTLDTNEEARRAASRANSVRFDESANHYAPSRQSMDLPTRTGSGLGSHPLSERSLSHRSDGRSSTIGFGRANSFGLEGSRLLGSIHNSPRVSGHPPPGLFALGPCPAIVRCWLTETFTNDTLMYAAVCSGAAVSSIGLATLQHLGLDSSIIEESGLRKIRLMVYLSEAKVNFPSSRSASPSPQVPTVTAKFVVDDRPVEDKSIQIVLGSDVLRLQSADILLSQDKLAIYDDDRNQLSVPLVRPEDDNVYRHLVLKARRRSNSINSEVVPSEVLSDFSAPGIIGRPNRRTSTQPTSPTSISQASAHPTMTASQTTHKVDPPRTILSRSSIDMASRLADDGKSTSATDSDPTTSTPSSKNGSSVWTHSWRSAAASSGPSDASSASKATTNPLRATAPRPMKVLKPSKSMANSTRSVSNLPTPVTGVGTENERGAAGNGTVGEDFSASTPTSATAADKTQSQSQPSTKVNPIGSGSAFGWLNSGQRKATISGGF